MTINPMNLPKLDFYINDFSGILNEEEKIKYNNLFAEHKNTSGEQIALVLFPHRQGNELKDIGLKLFNENGIGDNETNNGLMLIISTEEKKIRIITGKGMEVEFSDVYCSEIIEKELRPLLNNGEYIKLINSWYEITTKKRKVVEKVSYGQSSFVPNSSNNKIEYNNTKNKENKIIPIFIIIFAIILFFVLVKYGGNTSNSGNYQNSSSRSSNYDHSPSSSSSSDWGGGSSNGGGGGD